MAWRRMCTSAYEIPNVLYVLAKLIQFYFNII